MPQTQSTSAIMQALCSQRDDRGLSQQQIAEAIGCSQQRVSDLESGKGGEPKLSEIDLYAQAVGTTIPDLYRVCGNPRTA